MTVGDRIRETRKRRGLSQEDLGKKINKSTQVISNWERGYTPNISNDDLLLLSLALEVTVDYLVKGVDEFSDDKLHYEYTEEDRSLGLPPDWIEHVEFIRRNGGQLTSEEMSAYIAMGRAFAARIEREIREARELRKGEPKVKE